MNKNRRWKPIIASTFCYLLNLATKANHLINLKIFDIIFIEDEGRKKAPVKSSNTNIKGACAEIKRRVYELCKSS